MRGGFTAVSFDAAEKFEELEAAAPRLRRPLHGSPALHNITGRGAGQLTTARRAWARLWGRPRPCGADSQRSLSTLRRNLRNWRRRPRASDDLSTGYQHSTTSSDVALATSWACATPQARALAGIWAVATTCRAVASKNREQLRPRAPPRPTQWCHRWPGLCIGPAGGTGGQQTGGRRPLADAVGLSRPTTHPQVVRTAF